MLCAEYPSHLQRYSLLLKRGRLTGVSVHRKGATVVRTLSLFSHRLRCMREPQEWKGTTLLLGTPLDLPFPRDTLRVSVGNIPAPGVPLRERVSPRANSLMHHRVG